MHVRHATSPPEQRAHIAAPPRAMQLTERPLHAGNREIGLIIHGDHQKQPGARPALVELPCGMEVARTESQRRGAAQGPTPLPPQLLELAIRSEEQTPEL